MKKYRIALVLTVCMLVLCGCNQQQEPGEETLTPVSGEEIIATSGLPADTQAATQTTAEATTQPATEPTTVETTVPETEPVTEPAEVTTAPTEEAPSLGELVAQTAAAQVGKAYLYGGSGPDAFDTSGLVYYCFRENGISVPRATSSQADFGTEVEFSQLRPGDVVFFWTDTPGTAQFVGIYIGGNAFVSASSTKGTVREMEITSSYYTEHFVFARRFF